MMQIMILSETLKTQVCMYQIIHGHTYKCTGTFQIMKLFSGDAFPYLQTIIHF